MNPVPYTWIDNPQTLSEWVKNNSSIDCLAFDTEFIRENTFFPQMELIQVATRESCILVDFSRLNKNPEGKKSLDELFELFRNPGILKIGHALQADQECLYTSSKLIARPSFDTAFGAALLGMGENIGLQTLVKAVTGVRIAKGHSRTDWTLRPLPKQMMDYAASDVQYLIQTTDILFERLDQKGRKPWALSISQKWENESLYEPDPEEIAYKLGLGNRLDQKEYAALVSLVRWREDKARKLNIPRKWLADDMILVDLARVRPKAADHLSNFRGLQKGEIKKYGQEILTAIKDAEENPAKWTKKSLTTAPPTAEEQLLVQYVQTALAYFSHKYEISPRLLMTSAELAKFLQSIGRQDSQNITLEQLLEKKLLAPEVAGLIGNELIALLQGKKSLKIEHSKLVFS